MISTMADANKIRVVGENWMHPNWIGGTPASLPGHANISTTQRKMHLDDRELADAQDLVD
jgi:hypothetical protein